MTTLHELKMTAELHLKKSEELLAAMDFVHDVARHTQELNAIPTQMAEKAAFVTSELRLNYDQQIIFMRELKVMIEKPTVDALEFMLERFNQLKAHQLADILCCDDVLNSYKSNED